MGRARARTKTFPKDASVNAISLNSMSFLNCGDND